jgi:hypothetical protein
MDKDTRLALVNIVDISQATMQVSTELGICSGPRFTIPRNFD